MKIAFITLLTFLFLPFGSSSASTLAYPTCQWSQNGCTTSVYQFAESWYMSIVCDDGKDESFGGPGTWGGKCKEWVDGDGNKQTNLPDLTQ